MRFANSNPVRVTALALATTALAACGAKEAAPRTMAPVVTAGTALTLRDTTISATFDASGVAEPLQQATVSTKLMGTVTAVRVHEGDAVRVGQVLLEIDARDLSAKANQVAASIADAEAMQREAAPASSSCASSRTRSLRT
jgi:multidrug efflux pump subunit AcrA (membrane-fusion protein)